MDIDSTAKVTLGLIEVLQILLDSWVVALWTERKVTDVQLGADIFILLFVAKFNKFWKAINH